MVFEKTLYVPRNTVKMIERLLTVEPRSESECFSENEAPFSFSSEFEDRAVMIVHVCGVQYVKGQSNTAWSELLLCDKNDGSVIFTSEPQNRFLGRWEAENDGDSYILNIKEAV